MRLFLLILAICLTLTSIGCNSNLKCRRETALLRAEYLDLEDKYYALLSQSGAGSTEITTTQPSSAPVITTESQPVIYGSGVEHSLPETQNAPDIIYYDQTTGYPVDGQIYYQSQEIQTPTLAPPNEQNSVGVLRNSQSNEDTLDDYFPSPVESQQAVPPTFEPSINHELPEPESNLDGDQTRFGLEIENAHEAGHQVKIRTDSLITEVVINKSLSKGKNTDNRPGDDGIEILLQPKSVDGSVVDEAGNLTISLVDPSAEQGERQIGQWSFLRKEAELFFAEDEFGNRGILLNLSWDKAVPSNKRLTVYVRFETPDGRVMETTSNIFIDPPRGLAINKVQERSDSEFVELKNDQDQGWYKSQTTRGRRDRDLDWGQSSDRSDVDSVSRNSSRQPQWRPAR